MTRRDAIEATLSAGARVALARADSALARARLVTARAVGNPSLAASYSKSAPQQHLSLEIPLDAPWTRGARVGAARAAVRAAELRMLSEHAAAIVEADTTYTAALAAEARFRLARQTARDADSLLVLTTRRRDAGDASELDVDLAHGGGWAAGERRVERFADVHECAARASDADGISADSVAITLVDSLRPASTAADALLATYTGTALPRAPVPPSVRSAEASLQAAELAIVRERRSVFGLPAVSVGVEHGDPAGDEKGLLPVVGIVLPYRCSTGTVVRSPRRRRSATARARSSRSRGWRHGNGSSRGFASATNFSCA